MAQITLWGADYSDVPAVELPKTGGGTVVFYENGGTHTLETITATYTPSTSTITDTITPSSGYDGIEEVDVTVNAVPIANFYTTAESGYYTENNQRKWRVRGVTDLDIGEGDSEGWIGQGRYNGDYSVYNAVATGTTVTPSTSSQTIGGANYMMEGPVTVSAITIKQASVGDDGYQSEFYTENNVRKFRERFWREYGTGGYVGPFNDEEVVSEYWNIYNAVQSGTTITPSTSSQSIGGINYMMEGPVTVSAMPSGSAKPAATISGTAATVSTGTNTLTLSKTVSNTPQVTAGYVASGTAGNSSVSLTANVTTKGTATITPGTTNQTISSGTYITGTQTISGDANLVAGNIKSGTTIFGVTGTYSGGGGTSKNAQVVQQGNTRITATNYTKACGDITVSKTGTYDVYWSAYRTSTSGTWGTQLYIGNTAYGSAQTTFSNYYQTVHLSNVSLTANQTISVYGRSRGSNYYLYVGQLTIIEA